MYKTKDFYLTAVLVLHGYKIKQHINESEYITGHHGRCNDLHGDGRLHDANGKISALSDLPPA